MLIGFRKWIKLHNLSAKVKLKFIIAFKGYYEAVSKIFNVITVGTAHYDYLFLRAKER